ncbi:MAG: DUF177 domain-containing protein [Clostridia bacterium]|nr:DUF177 domain-containing protein [Clostridia bacterium]
MIIDVRKQRARGVTEDEFSYDYAPDESLCAVPLFNFEGPVSVKGDFRINDDDTVDVHVEIRFRLTGSCSYCLEPAAADIEYEYDALFVPYESDDDYPYEKDRVEVDLAVNDAILFSQPQVILCRVGCRGIEVINEENEE